MKRVITLGEVMLRLSTPGYERFTQATNFQAVYGGSEANVAVSLAHLGMEAEHVTQFPDNDLGKAATQSLRMQGVHTEHITFTEGRMGLYFLENGAIHRASRIIYDRFDSAFSYIQSGTFDWDEIMSKACWFHWTGITPAISQGAADVCKEAIKAAKEHGVTVSGDINYRRNLWQYGKSPLEIMPALIEMTDIVVAGITDFENCLHISGNSFEEASQAVMKAYPSIRKVTTTYRSGENASQNELKGVIWNGSDLYHSKEYSLTHIVDRVGGGDAFMAGMIYCLLNNKTDQESIEFAVAASALKHTIPGDVNLATLAEVEALVNGKNVGKLLR